MQHSTRHHFGLRVGKRREHKTGTVTKTQIFIKIQCLKVLGFAWSISDSNPFNATEYVYDRRLANIRVPNCSNHKPIFLTPCSVKLVGVVLQQGKQLHSVEYMACVESKFITCYSFFVPPQCLLFSNPLFFELLVKSVLLHKLSTEDGVLYCFLLLVLNNRKVRLFLFLFTRVRFFLVELVLFNQCREE